MAYHKREKISQQRKMRKEQAQGDKQNMPSCIESKIGRRTIHNLEQTIGR